MQRDLGRIVYFRSKFPEASTLSNLQPLVAFASDQVLVSSEGQKGTASGGNTLLVFTVYTDKDVKIFRDIQLRVINNLKRDFSINCQNKQILTDEIEESYGVDYLDKADLSLLLVGQIFTGTEYCKKMEQAIGKMINSNRRIYPILLEQCSWKNTPLKDLGPLPKDGKPINKWTPRSDAFYNIECSLREILRYLDRGQP